MSSCGRVRFSAFVFAALYVVFVGTAFLLRAYLAESGVVEIWGWDYQTFVGQIQDWRWIGYFGFRHPGLGLVCSPLVALEHIWSGAYLLVMPAVATATAWMIWRMSGWLGLGVWLVMPTTWILAGVPESFPIAQLALVGSVWSLERRSLRDTQSCAKSVVATTATASPTPQTAFRAVFPAVVWCVLNTMITLTNGVKPIVGWLVMNWKGLDRKVIVRGGMVVVGAVLLGVGFFYLRTLMTGRGMGAGIEATLSWIPAERNLPHELYGFFVRPVGLWQSFIVYPLTLFGIFQSVRARHTSSLLLFTSYFAVDVLIHGIVGWGMTEPWVFAPHWIWILPLLSGQVARNGK